MVRPLSVLDVGDGASDATRVRVIFVGAFYPCSGTLNVDLARSLVEPEGDGWYDRYRVLLVVDMLHTSGKHGIHDARKDIVTNPGRAVRDCSDIGGRV
jgi:hypothetical protein